MLEVHTSTSPLYEPFQFVLLYLKLMILKRLFMTAISKITFRISSVLFVWNLLS